MKVWGKILGFIFGLMLSKNIFGALFGMWLGHRFDKGRSLNFNNMGQSHGDEFARQKCFFYTTFSVMGYMAKVNGQVTKEEIAFATAYMNQLKLSAELKQEAQEAFRDGKTVGFPLESQLNEFVDLCRHRKDLCLLFLEIQIQVAFVDGELDESERAALHKIASVLGFSVSDLDRLLEMMQAGAQFHQGNTSSKPQTSAQQVSNAYKVLGVSHEFSLSEIKKAYRKLMSQHHPDKLVAKGLPPEMMEVAKQKTQDIQAAYEIIVKDKSK